MSSILISLLIVILFLLIVILSIDMIAFIIRGKSIIPIVIIRIIEIISLIILPYIYVTANTTNDCCGDSTPFSPQHQLTILSIVSLCLIAYFYSSYRKVIAAPIVEILVNCLLLIGIVLNIFIAIQTKSIFYAACGNIPIIILGILMLAKNQQLFYTYTQTQAFIPKHKFEKIAWQILNLNPIQKFPLVLLLCLPILVILSSILLLVGQKPDSIVRAFTDTYKHGFSQWDYKCDNVECGGHYLCSVAANGHLKIVKPQRLGIRNGSNIICNRQLLVSNAFEELIQEKFPFIHKNIRQQYNKVGNFIHRYYSIFNNKFVSDFIYVTMKPLEWFFLFTLYCFDRNPENRIAKQYLSNDDRKQIEQLCHH
jgi:hypothetical protein